jgi:hypothetical protein
MLTVIMLSDVLLNAVALSVRITLEAKSDRAEDCVSAYENAVNVAHGN